MSKVSDVSVGWALARWAVGALTLAASVQALLCAVTPGEVRAATAASAGAAPTTDPLAVAAARSPRAAHSVLLAITRAGERLVAVGERGVILTSDDHGRQWQQATVPVSVTLTAVHFATPQLGWAVGHSGVVLHSSDGGQIWRKQLDGAGAAQAELVAAQAAAQASDDDASKRRLRDAQRALDEGADKPWLDVRFWSPTEGVVVGAYGGILRTRDGGRSWHSLRGHMANPKGRHLYHLHLLPDGFYLAGEQGSLYRARDKGDHIEALPMPYRGTLFGVHAQGSGELWVWGLRGNVLRSRDDGQSWQAVATGQPITLTAGTTGPDGRMLLADESGRLLQQAGEGLQPLRVPQPFAFTGVVTAADGSLVLTGARGTTRLSLDPRLASVQP